MGKNADGIDWMSRKSADGKTEYLETLPDGTKILISPNGHKTTVYTPPAAQQSEPKPTEHQQPQTTASQQGAGAQSAQAITHPAATNNISYTGFPAGTDPATVHHTTDDLAHQQKDVAFHGATGVTKNIFTDGSATFVKGGEVMGREPAGTETAHSQSPQTTAAQAGAAVPATPVQHQEPTRQEAAHVSGTSNAEDTHAPEWAKGLPGWKPGDKKTYIVNQGPEQSTSTIGYTDPKGNLVYQAPNGNVIEDPAGKASPYIVKKAEPTSNTPHDLPLGNEPAPVYQHSPGLSQSNPVSEHGQGGGFITDNSPAAQPRSETQAAAPVPAWHQNIAPDLGGIGGPSVTQHGTALATRDSKDGTHIIAQMSDGSYESIDKATGAVSGAGSWGDSHGGGVGINGIGNPAPASPTPVPTQQTETQPVSVVTSNVPTLPAGDATTMPSPGIVAMDPSAVASQNMRLPRHFMME